MALDDGDVRVAVYIGAEYRALFVQVGDETLLWVCSAAG